MNHSSKNIKFLFICLIIIVCVKYNQTEDIIEEKSNHSNKAKILKDVPKVQVNSQKNESKKSETKNKNSHEIIKNDNDLYNIMQQHSMFNFNKELRIKDQNSEKKKGKLQTVGSVFGDIIGVIISELVRIFGNLVGDVAREVTAHGFVSFIKQFTDITGLTFNEINFK